MASCAISYCTYLLRKTKKSYYENLNVNLITDNKTFWKYTKPLFSDKSPTTSNIVLLEGNKMFTDSAKCAEILNNFFSDAAINLEIDRTLHTLVSNASDPVTIAIERYKNHPSIIKLNQECFPKFSFDFQHIFETDILVVIENLDSSKAFQKDNIPPKFLKDNKDICSTFLTNDVNRCIGNGKYADITPLFKKHDRSQKSNYRPISILPTLSKIYEKIFFTQIYRFFNGIFSKYLYGFRKGHSTQHCLLYMLENLRKSLDKRLKTGVLLTDLSKAFDSISHDLLIAKLNAYGFCKNALNLVNDYLTDRKQRTKIDDTFSPWRDILYGVPQGSILGPLLFNIYIDDVFLFSKEFKIANYADDCSPFEFSGSINELIHKLEVDSLKLVQWFKINYMKPNPDKWHLLLSDQDTVINITVDNQTIFNSSCEKILGINFDNKLKFNTHVTKLCKKASQKLHALARISNFMSVNQKKLIFNAFIYSQFNYCPVIWMRHIRSLNTKINRIHERALRIVYNDNCSSFDVLLQKCNSVTIHHRNIQNLAIEIYKALHDLSSSLVAEIFTVKDTGYKLRGGNKLISDTIKTVNYGKETISYLAPKIWELIPEEIRNSCSLTIFKGHIRAWIPINCPCRLCKEYIPNLVYL